MKWWYWLILELLIIFGVIAWIYFFPSELEGDFAKVLIGFVLFYAIENCKDINRRNKMGENYTVEQNVGENQIEGGVVSISGSVDTFRCWKCGRTLPISERADFIYASNPPKYACKECERIKKEKQFRPFNNCDELIEVFREKCEAEVNCSTFFPKLYKACVWVKSKEYGTENLIIAFDNDNESIGGSCVFIQDIWVDMKELFDNFTFLDGSPCGLEE